MSFSEEAILKLVTEAEQREIQARRRALLFTLAPLILAGLLVWFTSQQIQKLGSVQADLAASEQILDAVTVELEQSERELFQSQQALDDLNARLDAAQRDYQEANVQLAETRRELEQAHMALEEAERRADDLQRRIDELTRQLRDLSEQWSQASTFNRYEVEITPEMTKEGLSYYWTGNLFLIDLLFFRDTGVPFNPTGFSMEEGFNSPNFAAYILEQNGLLPPDYDFDRKPWEQLPHTPLPASGDIVFYESGYTMFYFALPEPPFEFVIGMTPVGVVTLQPDFAPALGYLRVDN